jgi:hypothetical protein
MRNRLSRQTDATIKNGKPMALSHQLKNATNRGALFVAFRELRVSTKSEGISEFLHSWH